MTLTPIGNRVVVTLDVEKETTSASGIILTTESKETEKQIATVTNLGTGKDSEGQTPTDLGLKIGQKVLIGKYGGEEYEDPQTGVKYKILKTGDIYAILS